MDAVFVMTHALTKVVINDNPVEQSGIREHGPVADPLLAREQTTGLQYPDMGSGGVVIGVDVAHDERPLRGEHRCGSCKPGDSQSVRTRKV